MKKTRRLTAFIIALAMTFNMYGVHVRADGTDNEEQNEIASGTDADEYSDATEGDAETVNLSDVIESIEVSDLVYFEGMQDGHATYGGDYYG